MFNVHAIFGLFILTDLEEVERRLRRRLRSQRLSRSLSLCTLCSAVVIVSFRGRGYETSVVDGFEQVRVRVRVRVRIRVRVRVQVLLFHMPVDLLALVQCIAGPLSVSW